MTLSPEDRRRREFAACRAGIARGRELVERALRGERPPFGLTSRAFGLDNHRQVYGEGTPELVALDSARRTAIARELLAQAEQTLNSRWARIWTKRRLALRQAIDGIGLWQLELAHLNRPAE